jgi:hypothetical protein
MFDTAYMLRLKVKTMGFAAREMKADESLAHYHASLGNYQAEEARQVLHNARTHSLRKEARSANLAYGFYLGRGYGRMEQTCHERPDLARVEALVMKYSGGIDPREVRQRFAQWLDEAREYLQANPPMSEVPKQEEAPPVALAWLYPDGFRIVSMGRGPIEIMNSY